MSTPASLRSDCRMLCVGIGGAFQLESVVEFVGIRIRKKRAGIVFIQRIEFGLIHGRFNGERPANVRAEKADVDPSYLFPDQQNGFPWQLKLFVEPADLRVEETKRSRQSRAMDL